jgi:hypothetical protein
MTNLFINFNAPDPAASKRIDNRMTTLALHEEGGNISTEAIGEEGGNMTTLALYEEGGTDPGFGTGDCVMTKARFEDGGDFDPPIDFPHFPVDSPPWLCPPDNNLPTEPNFPPFPGGPGGGNQDNRIIALLLTLLTKILMGNNQQNSPFPSGPPPFIL